MIGHSRRGVVGHVIVLTAVLCLVLGSLISPGGEVSARGWQTVTADDAAPDNATPTETATPVAGTAAAPDTSVITTPGEPLADETSAESPASLVFSDDFEVTGDLSRWNGARSLAPEQSLVYGGDFAARGVSSGSPSVAQTTLESTYDELFYRARFNIVSLGENSVALIRLRNEGGDAIVGIFVSNAYRLGMRIDVSGDVLTSASIVSPNAWHEIQVRVLINGRESRTDVWLDGQHVEDLSRVTWLGSLRVGRLDLGDTSGGRTFDVVFDDVAVDTAYIASDRIPDPTSGTLTVITNPSLAGVPFVLDGRTFHSDQYGIARVEVEQWSSDLRQRIQVPITEITPGLQVAFGRWTKWSRGLNSSAVVNLDIYRPVTWSFVDLEGQPVDPAIVTSMTLKSSVGGRFVYDPSHHGLPQFIQSSREIPTLDGVETKFLYYTVEQATVGGGEVVIKSRQKFFPNDSQHWEITLLFYPATFHARDAFFGFSIGKTIVLTYPDGTVLREPLDENGDVTFASLPRGEYTVGVEGDGYSPPRPIAVSRPQDVELEVFSHIDMAVSLSVMAAIGFGLLFAGRPKLLSPRHIVRSLLPARQPKPEPEVAR